MTVSVKELSFFFAKIIEKLKLHGIEEIPLKTDYYLTINANNWDKLNEDVIPNIGSLNDDIDSLRKTKFDNAFTFIDFDRVSAILRAISQELCPDKES